MIDGLILAAFAATTTAEAAAGQKNKDQDDGSNKSCYHAVMQAGKKEKSVSWLEREMAMTLRNKSSSQITQCTCPTTHLSHIPEQKVVCCGISDKCIVGFMRLVLWIVWIHDENIKDRLNTFLKP